MADETEESPSIAEEAAKNVRENADPATVAATAAEDGEGGGEEAALVAEKRQRRRRTYKKERNTGRGGSEMRTREFCS